MIDRNAPWKLRLQFALAILGLVGAGCIAVGIGLSTLLPSLRGSAVRAPMVEFRPLYVTALPLAVSFFAFTVLALLPKSKSGPRRARTKRGSVSAVNFVFGVMVCGALLSTVAAPIGRWAMSDVMAARGYTACPPSEEQRRPPMRWVRPGVRCH